MRHKLHSSHAKQRLHTSQTKLHSKNKWLFDSSSTLQRLHKGLSTAIPRFSKLTLVASLFSNTLQAVTSAEGRDLHLQSCLNTVTFSPSWPPHKTIINRFNRIWYRLPILPNLAILLFQVKTHTLDYLWKLTLKLFFSFKKTPSPSECPNP